VFITQEVYPGTSGQDAQLDPAYFEPTGSVTSFDYSYAITDDFEDGDLAALDSFYSSFDFSSYNQEPPDNAAGYVTDTVCGEGTWECTEQNPAIDALIGWHERRSRTSSLSSTAAAT
jgi:alpha-amylase